MFWQQERPWLETFAIPIATIITDTVTATHIVATIITTSLGSLVEGLGLRVCVGCLGLFGHSSRHHWYDHFSVIHSKSVQEAGPSCYAIPTSFCT